MKFRNLVALSVYTDCFDSGSRVFHLMDDDIEDLAFTLPKLNSLQLGHPCHFDTCNTTVASLLSISVHYLDLTVLQTYLNT